MVEPTSKGAGVLLVEENGAVRIEAWADDTRRVSIPH
jgi:hypothetical protein